MKRVLLSLLTAIALLLLCTISIGAKPVDTSVGLDKGNKTYEVPANTWVGVQVWNTVGTGHITRVELLVDDKAPIGMVRMALYSSTPCFLMEDLGYATVADGWVSISGLNIPVTDGRPYILAFDLQSSSGIRAAKKFESPYGLSSMAPLPYDAANLRLSTYLDYPMDAPAGGSYSPVQYVIRATVIPD